MQLTQWEWVPIASWAYVMAVILILLLLISSVFLVHIVLLKFGMPYRISCRTVGSFSPPMCRSYRGELHTLLLLQVQDHSHISERAVGMAKVLCHQPPIPGHPGIHLWSWHVPLHAAAGNQLTV